MRVPLCATALLLVSLVAVKASPAPTAGSAASKPLNREELLSLYMSGDFETLIFMLENIRHDRPVVSRADSVFMYKLLGVVYGADQTTKQKSEDFLYKMLELDPREDLSALGVGETVNAIFQRARSRYLGDHPAAASAAVSAAAASPAPASAASAPGKTGPAIEAGTTEATAPGGSGESATAPSSSQWRRIPKWVWLAGGGVTAAAALTGILLAVQAPGTNVHVLADSL